MNHSSITHKKKPNTSKQVETILHPLVKKWFFSRFNSFSLPQLYGVMEIHSRKNTLVSAPTGATKTLTGFLSILNELVDSSLKGILEDRIYCLYISPLKALNYDIHVNLEEPLKEMNELCKEMYDRELNIRVAVRTGDTTASEKSKMLKKPPHILITTPESLAIVLTSPKFSEHFPGLQWVIIDEIHALAENKRGVHLSLSLERLQRFSPHLTRVGLSATVSPLEEIAKFLVGLENNSFRPCQIIDVQFIKKSDFQVLSPVQDLINTEHYSLHQKLYHLIHSLINSHRTTLIFTNTRSGTERVVHYLKEKFPQEYNDQNIGAHHGSLSKTSRRSLEKRLRQGQLKAVVCSTSLELGIDIGYVDLVLALGSPKSVARFLQRAGRSGHKLHDTTKARMIVLDRDDLVECSTLLKSAVEKKIDQLHLPSNCLDVLAQQIFGIAIKEKILLEDLWQLVKSSYCFKDLKRSDFMEVIDYLSGQYSSLEQRHVYAKIWYDPETGFVGRKGRLSRVIYMTNIGTIPDESFVLVKEGEQVLGKIDEGFLEKLKKGDVFVLGGRLYEFRYARGQTAQVSSSVRTPPTVPSWFSETLPLSYDLALDIGKFRRLMEEKFVFELPKKEILEFIHHYLYVDDQAALAIYHYFKEQFLFSLIPHDKRILVESYHDDHGHYYVFHTCFGRRVNDALSRAVGFVISKTHRQDVNVGITDYGFFIFSTKPLLVEKAFSLLTPDNFSEVLNHAVEKSEILARRFRHCAARSLMILRNYKGRKKRVGRQQVSSKILMSYVKRLDQEFPILKEARREVLEDLMDAPHALDIITLIQQDKIKIDRENNELPSPFALNLVSGAYLDTLRMEDKNRFLKRMHQNILAKISLKKGIEKDKEFVNYIENSI